MGTGDPNSATAFALRNTPLVAILALSAVVSLIGLMISYYGWADIKKWKAAKKNLHIKIKKIITALHTFHTVQDARNRYSLVL
jgi:hypothetical protein